MEILIPISLFAMIAAVVILPCYFKSVERQKMAETLRVAIERGQPLPTEVIDAMSSNVRSPGLPASPQRDLRTGIIWMGIGLGVGGLGLALSFDDPNWLFKFIGISAFPIFIGLAFVALGLMNRTKS